MGVSNLCIYIRPSDFHGHPQTNNVIILAMANQLRAGVLIHLLFLVVLTCSVSLSSPHPLDPLSSPEIDQVRQIILSSLATDHGNCTFNYVGLDDPVKTTLLSWLSKQTQLPPPRRAFIIARFAGETHEFVVDLSASSIHSHKVYKGLGHPIITLDEQNEAQALPNKYKPFIKSIKERGLEPKKAVCIAYSVGWFGESGRGRREVMLLCSYSDGSSNIYARPIDGISILVDIEEMKITKYFDRFRAPLPKAEGTEYRASAQKPPFGPQLTPTTVVQPNGPGFRIHGYLLRCAKIFLF